jgi:DNA gyrase subunit B
MTDADVDGSHIRSLLLTFFYRHMKEVIDRGYLYIAQPPLYKVKQGNKELYLKSEDALQDYVLKSAAESSEITGGKTVISDSVLLLEFFYNLVEFVKWCRSMANQCPIKLIELMALSGLFDNNMDASDMETRLRTDPTFDWKVTDLNDDNITLCRTIRGKEEVVVIHRHSGNVHNMRHLAKAAENVRHMFQYSCKIKHKGGIVESVFPSVILDEINLTGSRGMSIQRFKGLGEMNADQLWDTTLNPDTRTLLQVKIDDEVDTDGTFTTLMGDVVELRKKFITENALNVVNLDI